MNKFSKELIESMTEACEHAEGKPSPGTTRHHPPAVPHKLLLTVKVR
jgi:hypothetical protein